MPSFPAAIATRGHVLAMAVFSTALAMRFRDFDSMIEGAEEAVPEIHAAHAHIWESYGSDSIELYLVGWSKKKNGPVGFTMTTQGKHFEDMESIGVQNVEALKSSGLLKETGVFELIEFGEFLATPAPDFALLSQLGFAPTSVEEIDPELAGLQLLQSQRQQKITISPGMPLLHYVGAFAQRTTIRKNGIEQRIFYRWPEDKVGELIAPAPIDFAKWRAEHVPANPAFAAPPGMSRLKREMAARKRRKAA
jgi:hypothetical protein